MAITGLKGRASGYNYFCNDVNGVFGTDVTASGIPLSTNKFTCAIPMKDENTPFKLGDVLLVKNNITGQSILVMATDVGGLPHADIDLAEGVATKSLGMETTKHDKRGGVGAMSNATDIEVIKVGNVDFKDKDKSDKALSIIASVNKGENGATLKTLKEGGVLRSEGEGIDWDKTLTSYAANLPKQTEFSRKAGYQDRDPDKTRRSQVDLMDFVNQLPQEDQMFVMMLLMIVGLVTGEDPQKMLDGLMSKFGGVGGDGAFGRPDGGSGAGPVKFSGNYEIGGHSDKYAKLEMPKYNKGEDAGAYIARCAKSFRDVREVGNNGGDLPNWVMEKAGFDGQGQPWCAGFASKMYEGLGVFEYTAGALNFAAQGLATKSYKQGLGALDGISVGDPVVFERGTLNDGKGHVGICTGVNKDASGRVISIETTEGNSGDKVAVKTYDRNDLENSRYLGFVDIKDRAKKMNVNLEEKLTQHFYPEVQQQKAPEKDDPAAKAKAQADAALRGEKPVGAAALLPSQIPDIRGNVPAAPQAPATGEALKPVDPSTLPKPTAQVSGKSGSASIA